MTKILIIEDEPNVRENIQELLEIEGFFTVTAVDGVDGLQKAIAAKPSLIISDVMMPGMDGFTLLKEIRKMPELFFTPFIFLTAKNAVDDRVLGMDLGADDFIAKPYRNESLIAAIKNKLARHQAYQSSSNTQLEELRHKIACALPHEFRTPLNGILGFAQLLKCDYDSLIDTDRKMMIDQIYDSAVRMKNLITNFIFYTSLLTSESEDRKGCILNFPKIVFEDIIEALSETYPRAKDIVIDIEQVPIRMLETDFYKLCYEIIDNALKFSEDNTLVTIKGNIVSDKLIIKITNSGRGLSHQQIASIGGFVQFERENFEQQGIGLGLAIAKRIIDIYHGILEINSTPNRFTEVKLGLPIYII